MNMYLSQNQFLLQVMVNSMLSTTMENLTHIKELMYCLQNLNYMDYCISQAYTE